MQHWPAPITKTTFGNLNHTHKEIVSFNWLIKVSINPTIIKPSHLVNAFFKYSTGEIATVWKIKVIKIKKKRTKKSKKTLTGPPISAKLNFLNHTF